MLAEGIISLTSRLTVTCSTIETPERRHGHHFSVFIVNFKKSFTPFSSVSIVDFEQVDFNRVTSCRCTNCKFSTKSKEKLQVAAGENM